MANIEIGGRLHSTATGNVVTGANEVLDDIQNKKQQEINAELIEAVGTGGSVDSRIAAAVNVEKNRAEGAEQTLSQAIRNLRDAGYAFGGIAVTDTNPGVPSGNCFYIVRGTGTYTHFKNADNEPIVLVNDGLYVLTYESVENNYWEWNPIIYFDDEHVVQNGLNLPTSKAVYDFKDVFTYISKNNGIDLCIVDKKTNCIVYFKNGHIKTKNFDSSNVAANLSFDVENDSSNPLDFAISDLTGNKPLVVIKGHILTKEFNSQQAAIGKVDDIKGFVIQDGKNNVVLAIKENGRIITNGFDSDNISIIQSDLNFGLAVQDKNGNTVLLVKDGHIQAKEFNSKQAGICKKAELNGFAIQDGLGNKVLLIKKNGRIITKGFDSDNIKLVSAEQPIDLALQDGKEKILALFKRGHIITKEFDSRKVVPIVNQVKNNVFFLNEWSGKNICFLGDSIIDNNFVCNAIKDTLKCNIYNRGWGGAMITPTKYLQGSDASDYSKKGYHFTNVCDIPEDNDPDNHYGGMPSADLIDLVVIHGGGNDYGHGNQTSRTVIGVGSIEEAMGNDLNYLPEGETDPYATVGSTFAAALKYTCYKLRQKYPNIPVAICTIFRSYDYAGQSSHTEYYVNQDMSIIPNVRTYRDGVKNKEDFNNIIRAVARQFGMYVIDFDKFGMPSYNEYFGDLYYVHKESTGHGDLTHPSENYGAWNYGKFMSKEIMMIPYMDKSKVEDDSGDYPDNPEGN